MSGGGYNLFLQRLDVERQIREFLSRFASEYKNLSFKKGLYIYGSPGSGKTYFVNQILKDMDYDIVSFDAGSVRNKSLIDAITSNNMSSQNVLNIMYGRAKKIAILMDEVDGMNNGDKGGITSLIKLIRQKRTKKQKMEPMAFNPIICVGNHCIDKKIKELMKVCEVYELKSPTEGQVERILGAHYPHLLASYGLGRKDCLLRMINGDLRKIDSLQRLFAKDPALLRNDAVLNKLYNYKRCRHIDVKEITHAIMKTPHSMNTHTQFINETDRTIVGLLYHENIIDDLRSKHGGGGGGGGGGRDKVAEFYLFYDKILDNMCFADYIDRITFQFQIWIFNEMSSLIKTYYNNMLFHASFGAQLAAPPCSSSSSSSSIRFTKVLTKYSTEYNNQIFLFNLCIELQMDKKDMIAFFQEMRAVHATPPRAPLSAPLSASASTDIFQEIFAVLEKGTNISKLDVKRIYRYLDKNIKLDSAASVLSSFSAIGAVAANPPASQDHHHHSFFFAEQQQEDNSLLADGGAGAYALYEFC